MQKIFRELSIFIFWFWLVFSVSFFIGRLSPGDPLSCADDSGIILSSDATSSKISSDLKQPIYKQYFEFCKQCVRSRSLGSSYHNKNLTVLKLLKTNNLWLKTLEIILLSFFISVIVSVSLGAVCALYANSFIVMLIHFVLSTISAIPIYLLQPFLTKIFVLKLKWFASGGWGNHIFSDWYHLTLPVGLLALKNVAELTKYAEDSFQDVFSSTYIRAAKAKGLPFQTIFFSHALKPAILPMIYNLSAILTSSFFNNVNVESWFCIYGLSRAFTEMSAQHEHNLMLGLTLCFVIFSQTVALIANQIQKISDPKRMSALEQSE